MAELLQLNNTTFRPVPGGDVRAIITVGGRKDPSKFIPALNMSYSFGGDEEYFDDLNRIDKFTTSKSEVKFDGEKVRLIAGSDIDEIYTDAQGRMKWDVVFERCPKSMVLEWRRTCSPGLTAYYQPALTDEEIKEGAHRPDDVIGSYAIYCDKAHNWIRPLDRKREIPKDWKAQLSAGAALGDVNISAYREYKTGKVGHQYRPFVIDADGRTEWCTLLIVGNVERVTLPKEFMASAKYPVRLDPTFGYTSAPATYSNWTVMRINTNDYIPSSDGTVTAVYVYCRVLSSSYNIICGYYDDNAGAPSTAHKTTLSISNTTAAWNSGSLSGSLTSGNEYYPAFAWSSSSLHVYYDSGQSGGRWRNSDTDMYDNPSSLSYTAGDVFGVYIEYTESGGSSSVPVIVNHLRNQGVM